MKSSIRVEFIHLAGFESRHAVFRIPPLTFPCLAALTPPDVNLSLTDESFEPIDFDKPVDLVGISVILPFAPKAYEIARRFRSRGVKVVLGGHHVTAMPHEASKFADSIVIGEGDLAWPKLLDDLRHDRLQPVYHESSPNLRDLPPPRMNLLNAGKYSISNAVLATRGCPYVCDYCCIRNTAPTFRMRPVEHVVRDMKNAIGNRLQQMLFMFWDDNLAGNRQYALELFRAIKPLRRYWFCEATIGDFARDDEFVKLAAESGCRGVFCGIESFNQESLRGVRKGFNKVSCYREYIKRLHDHGIGVDAGMMIGFDEDDKSIFDRTLDTAIQLNIDVINLVIATPYPGTPLYAKLEAEGRILHRDWSLYDGHHAVFRPKHMSPEELEEGWHRVRSEFYSLRSIFKRFWKSGAPIWLKIPHNMSTRRFVRMERKRFANPDFEYSTVVREIWGKSSRAEEDGYTRFPKFEGRASPVQSIRN